MNGYQPDPVGVTMTAARRAAACRGCPRKREARRREFKAKLDSGTRSRSLEPPRPPTEPFDAAPQAALHGRPDSISAFLRGFFSEVRFDRSRPSVKRHEELGSPAL